MARVAPQPFFETALAGTGFCTGFANCTQAVVSQEFGNLRCQCVWDLWSDLDNGAFNFPRSMLNTPLPTALGSNGQISGGVGVNASVGHGNYNAGFVSLRIADWKGLTLQQNFTYSKALGTGAFVQATSEYTPNDPFNLDRMYGVQAFDRTFVYNLFTVYQPSWYKNQSGLMGRLLGGWTFAPIFTTGSGSPLYCNTQTDAESFGSADAANFFTNEQCVFTSKYNGGNSTHLGVVGGVDASGKAVGTSTAGSTPVSEANIFADPVAVYSGTRAPILGIDNRNSGVGPIRGLPYWNVDFSLKKNIRMTERFNAEAQVVFTNLFNHKQFANPTLDISSPSSWGVLSTQGNTPRQMEFGFRVNF